MAHIFTSADKAKIALEALKGTDPPNVIASAHHAHPIQVGRWKKRLSEHAHLLFDIEQSETKKIKEMEAQIDELHRIIGTRDAELVWLKKKSGGERC